jgi:acyl carrier protein
VDRCARHTDREGAPCSILQNLKPITDRIVEIDWVDNRRVGNCLPRPPSRPREFSMSVKEVVAEVWCELLEVPAANEDEDFFSLGGNSLLALSLVNQLEKRLGIVFPLDAFFVEGTFGALVEGCDAAAREIRSPQ